MVDEYDRNAPTEEEWERLAESGPNFDPWMLFSSFEVPGWLACRKEVQGDAKWFYGVIMYAVEHGHQKAGGRVEVPLDLIFEVAGITEESLERALSELTEYKLIEVFERTEEYLAVARLKNVFLDEALPPEDGEGEAA